MAATSTKGNPLTLQATDKTESRIDPTPPIQPNDLLRAQLWHALHNLANAMRDDEPEADEPELQPQATPDLLRDILGINLSDLAKQPAALLPLLLNALGDLRDLLATALAEDAAAPNPTGLQARLSYLSTTLQQAGYANATAIASLPDRLRAYGATEGGRDQMTEALAQINRVLG